MAQVLQTPMLVLIPGTSATCAKRTEVPEALHCTEIKHVLNCFGELGPKDAVVANSRGTALLGKQAASPRKKRLDRRPASSGAVAAQAAAAISPLLLPTSLQGGNTHPGLTEQFILWLCMTLTPNDEPSKYPQRLVIMTPAHHAQSFRCYHITSVTAFPCDRVTSRMGEQGRWALVPANGGCGAGSPPVTLLEKGSRFYALQLQKERLAPPSRLAFRSATAASEGPATPVRCTRAMVASVRQDGGCGFGLAFGGTERTVPPVVQPPLTAYDMMKDLMMDLSRMPQLKPHSGQCYKDDHVDLTKQSHPPAPDTARQLVKAQQGRIFQTLAIIDLQIRGLILKTAGHAWAALFHSKETCVHSSHDPTQPGSGLAVWGTIRRVVDHQYSAARQLDVPRYRLTPNLGFQALLRVKQLFKNTMATPTPMTGIAVTPTPATGTVATQTPATGTAAEPESQPVPVSVAPIHKRKSWKRKSARLVRDEEASPKREQEEEALRRQAITRTGGGRGRIPCFRLRKNSAERFLLVLRGRGRTHKRDSNHPISSPE
ncbi:hypothetical protein QYF61_003847 [Mycteria americana]|uniref:Uncharacterized protein n=1 Tax=Mycteria americana TaxID=33587 RepID=A0AAN7PNH8_MYCAM|nr:hypothetical protein QYF61_003847 [Mycteria americana]